MSGNSIIVELPMDYPAFPLETSKMEYLLLQDSLSFLQEANENDAKDEK